VLTPPLNAAAVWKRFRSPATSVGTSIPHHSLQLFVSPLPQPVDAFSERKLDIKHARNNEHKHYKHRRHHRGRSEFAGSWICEEFEQQRYAHQ